MTLTEIYEAAPEALAAKGIEFSVGGVETESLMRHNREIFQRYRFSQKAINSIEVSTATKLLDVELQTPIVMSSFTAPLPSAQENGLVKVARALKAVGSMMWTGTPFPDNLEELVETGVPVVQTVKPYAKRKTVREWLTRAEAAGASWVGVEVDAGQGTKVRDRIMTRGCSPMSVDELRAVREAVSVPFVLKGILSEWDAERALEVGADVIVVSNHGAHTIESLPHPLEVMERIVSVVGGQIPIVVDSGFRRGTDVLKGLAFGASAVGLARPILYGLVVVSRMSSCPRRDPAARTPAPRGRARCRPSASRCWTYPRRCQSAAIHPR
jgi:isopentenyl diphosphate isomerase/L-lactate dehydrogenase-like FMN-dependent dehydrogenase